MKTSLLPALALPLLILLVTSPSAAAGPPEGVSGRMAFDVVCEGLRRDRKETDEGRRAQWLRKLARTGDPCVAVALGDALPERTALSNDAAILLYQYYMPPRDVGTARTSRSTGGTSPSIRPTSTA